MALDLNTPADNALISTFPAHIRQAKAEVGQVAVDISGFVAAAQQSAEDAAESAQEAAETVASIREVTSATVDNQGDLIVTFSDSSTVNAGNVMGPPGVDGITITSVTRTAGTGLPGSLDIYTITYSDSSTSTFTVQNGSDGAAGSDGNDGADGTDGNGIQSITRTSGTGLAGSLDTYTITFTDATTAQFTVQNGTDGLGSGDVVGPASSGAGNIVLFSDIDGKTIQDSGVALADLESAGAAASAVSTHESTYDHDLLHDPVATTDTTSVVFTLTGQQISADVQFGTTSGTVCQGNDSRLSDARTPTSHDNTAHSETYITSTALTGLLNETAHDLLDHTGLTGIPAAYTLPTASTAVIGGVKIDGTTITIADGVISSPAQDLSSYATKTGAETLTNKTIEAVSLTNGYTEEVYNLAGTEINPANGSIQYKTLTEATTFTEALADGQSVTLMLNPSTFAATWPTTTWIGSVASTAPALVASVYNCITFFQIAGTLYGKYEGRV